MPPDVHEGSTSDDGAHEGHPETSITGDDVLSARPDEAAHERQPTTVLGLLGTYVTGFAMGGADVLPAFSGGTVAVVAGIYERLIANVRQGAHVLSLLVRGGFDAALKAFVAIEWGFVVALLAGILTALLTLSAILNDLLDRHPIPMAAVFLGLILAATAVAQRELRTPAWYHTALILVVGGLTFYGLGWSPGRIDDPSLLLVFGAAAVAICAMILPGISGAFILVLLGMYNAVFLDGFGERDVPVMLTVAIGAVTGLALFSTLLNYLLRRWHDLILAVLLGVMLGSSRVLWPWPEGMEGARLAAPPDNDWLLGLSLASAAFAVVWIFGLLVPSPNERARQRRAAEAAEALRLEREHAEAERGAAFVEPPPLPPDVRGDPPGTPEPHQPTDDGPQGWDDRQPPTG